MIIPAVATASNAIQANLRLSIPLETDLTALTGSNAVLTRATQASGYDTDGLAVPVASGAARFHNYGDTHGVLLEGASEQLFIEPSDFTNSAWSKDANTTVTDNLDGSYNLSRASAAVGQWIMHESVTITAVVDDVYVLSLWVYQSDPTITTGRLILREEGGLATVTSTYNFTLTGTWTRVEVAHTITDATSTQLRSVVACNDTETTQEFDVRDAQLEVDKVTSFMPVQGVRNADALVATWPSGLVNDLLYTFNFLMPDFSELTEDVYLIHFRGDHTANYLLVSILQTTGIVRVATQKGADGYQKVDTSPLVADTEYSVKIRISSTQGLDVWIGEEGSTYTKLTGNASVADDFLEVLSSLHIGNSNVSTRQIEAATRQHRIYEGDFSDTEVGQLPTPDVTFPLVPTNFEIYEHQPNIVEITYSLGINSSDLETGFSFYRNGSPVVLSMAHQTSSSVIRYTLAEIIDTDDIILASYNAGTGDYVSTGGTYTLASFSNEAVTNNARTYAWLNTAMAMDDYPAIAPGFHTYPEIKAPRTYYGESRQSSDYNAMVKWDIHGAHTHTIGTCNAIQDYADANGITTHFHFMMIPVHTSEYESNDGSSMGHALPNADVGDTTTAPIGDPNNSTFYAGHWVYRPYTTTTQFLGQGAQQITVSNGSRITPNRYVCVHDGDWRNADHRLCTARSGNLVTLSAPFNCTPRTHNAGSHIAEHCYLNGITYDWTYNMSNQCPRDNYGAGEQLNIRAAEFLRDQIYYNWEGSPRPNMRWDGILYDVDREYEFTDELMDVNYDGVADRGVSPDGVNWWNIGLEIFYNKVNEFYPDWAQIGGDRWALDSGSNMQALNGTQEEAWFTGFQYETPTYVEVSAWFQNYILRAHRQVQPTFECALFKQGTRLYPTRGLTYPCSMVRLGMTAIAMDEGYYHHQAFHPILDTWYEEYAVNVIPGDPDYGNCLPKSEDGRIVHLHKDWLGDALSPYYRIIGAEFELAQNRITNTSFDSSIGGYGTTSSAMSISRDVSNYFTAPASLKCERTGGYQFPPNVYGILGESVSLTNGVEYTICFVAWTDPGHVRHIRPNFGGCEAQLLINEEKRRYATTFKATQTGSVRIRINTSQSEGTVWFDEFLFFEGNADLLRRDYENGIVLWNNSDQARTIDLGEVFQRPYSTQLDSVAGETPVYTGENANGSITLPAYDGIFLVRPDGQKP